ncbi:hypothetical protein BDW71DRAFT_203175 [Aspergillus fruticulosus]
MRAFHILPFAAESFDLTASSDGLVSLLPACYGDALVSSSGGINLWSPADHIITFVQLDLSVERLTKIQRYLWLAKSVAHPQPLSTIISLSHKITLDENIAMHLVWADRQHIHLKPFPRYLLDSRFWSTYLVCNETCPGTCTEAQDGTETETEAVCTCPRPALYKDALGFLFSYLTLIRFESDFIIAQDHSLLPPNLTWETWRSIVQQCLQKGVIHSQSINPRYCLGALRLSRLNKIYAFRYGSVLRGYRGQYKYTMELFQENVAPISAMTIYIALVLTAMQVGLATDLLGSNTAFQKASYGFAVFAILGPLAMVLFIYCVGALEVLSTHVFGVLRARRARRIAPLDEVNAQLAFLREVRGDA